MNLIDVYNDLAKEINKMSIEELLGMSCVDVENIDEVKLEEKLLSLYDKLIFKMKKGDKEEKKNGLYTLCFLILLFSFNDNESESRDREKEKEERIIFGEDVEVRRIELAPSL